MSNDNPQHPNDGDARPPSAPQYGAYRQPGDAKQGQGSQGDESAYRSWGSAAGGQAPSGYPQDANAGYGSSGYAPPQQLSAGLAIAAMVCGILGLLGGFLLLPALLGVVGIILGFVALSKIRRGRARGKGMAIAGIVTGILSLVVAAAVVILGVAFFQESGGSEAIDCIQKANGDQVKIQQCQNEFNSRLSTAPN